MESIIQDVKKMNKIYKVILIIIMLNFPKLLLSADMVGYLMNQAEQEYNDKNYQKAYTSLQNIAPTGNPKAIYLLGTMYLEGLGIDKNYEVAHEMILFASQNLYKNNKIMASEAQNILSEMYKKGIGTIKNNIEAYKWSYIANIAGNTNSLNLLSNLKSLISEEEEILAIKEAKLFLSKISNKEDNQ